MDRQKRTRIEKDKAVSTVMNLPKTREQIKLNHKFSYRLKNAWKDLLNEFFQPRYKFSQREADLIALGVAMSAIVALYMGMWVTL